MSSAIPWAILRSRALPTSSGRRRAPLTSWRATAAKSLPWAWSAPEARDAVQTAERVRKTIEQAVIIEKKITLSIGVSTVTRGISKKDLIAHADEALYYAKRNGRNRVCLYEEIRNTEALAIPKK